MSGAPDSRRTVGEPAPVPPAPSVPAALEKLASATQRVISKRIDLVTLEGHELVSALITRGALMAFGAVTGIAAWFAATTALVLFLMPGSSPPVHFAVFAAINAGIAAIVVAFALREQLPTMGGEAEDHREHDEAERTADRTGDRSNG